MSVKNKFSTKLLTALTGLGMISGSAQAELIAYDQFSGYTVGSLVGQGQGFGWGTNNWVGQTDASGAVATTTNLTYPGITSDGGGGITGNNGTGDNGWLLRDLGTPITTTGTYYFGFLVQVTGNPSKASFRLQDANGQNIGVGAWDGKANYQTFAVEDGWIPKDTGISRNENTNFFVIKLDYNTASGVKEVATVYINPTSAADLSAAGVLAPQIFDTQWAGISRIQANFNGASGQTGTMAFDEIRIGTEAADMFGAISEPTPSDIRITATSFDDSTRTFSLTWKSDPASTYTLWESPDLTGASWRMIDNTIPGQTDTTSYDLRLLPPEQTEQFYRVSKNP